MGRLNHPVREYAINLIIVLKSIFFAKYFFTLNHMVFLFGFLYKTKTI